MRASPPRPHWSRTRHASTASGAIASALITTLPGNGCTTRLAMYATLLAIDSKSSDRSRRSTWRSRPNVSASTNPRRRPGLSGLQVAYRAGQRFELGAPGARRDDRAHDELREPDADELLDDCAQGGQTDRRQLDRARPTRRHHARHVGIDRRTRVAQAHAEVLGADRPPGLRRDVFDHLAALGRFLGRAL